MVDGDIIEGEINVIENANKVDGEIMRRVGAFSFSIDIDEEFHMWKEDDMPGEINYNSAGKRVGAWWGFIDYD